MIRFKNLTKIFDFGGKLKTVADDISVTFPTGEVVGLLGRNGTGKSTMLNMISGSIKPSSGRIVTKGDVSWTVGFGGFFHPELTGAQNARFVARVYGVDSDELVAFVEDFAGLGIHFHIPIRTYSSGMRSRLAFGVSMGIPFDIYLVDEVTAVGDAAFREKSAQVFKARMTEGSGVVVSHSMAQVRDLCTAGAVLEGGKIHYYPNVDDAISHHNDNMKRAAG